MPAHPSGFKAVIFRGGLREQLIRFLKVFRYQTPIDFETGYTCGNLAIALLFYLSLLKAVLRMIDVP